MKKSFRKRILACFVCLIILTGMIPALPIKASADTSESVTASTYNSVPVGAAWYDTAGNPIQAHGGGFLQHDGWYYWVGEDKADNSSDTHAINLYRSKDLLNWEFVTAILSDKTNPGENTDETPGLIDPTTGNFNMERPKLIYDKASGKFILFAHWENGNDYTASHLLIASADTVDGHYTVLHNFRPGAYTSRDFTVYQDPDSGKGYVISTQDWQNMRVYPLTEDGTNVDTDHSYLLFSGGRREAPALIKADGVYYIITSLQSGWYPNQAMYSYTTNIDDPNSWSTLQPVGNNTTFYSQPTNIMEIDAQDGTPQYVYMGDHWNPGVLGASTYVWLPLNIDSATHTMSMNYTPAWSMNKDTGKFEFPNVTNVSQGKPVEGEDNVVAGKLLKYINDGSSFEAGNPVIADTWSPDTQYYAQNKVPYSVTIDLQNIYDLSRVDLSFKQYNGSESYYDYTIQGSNDDKNWTLLADETQNKTVGFKSDMLKGKYRYVKLNVIKVINDHNGSSTASWENGLLEVQVYANNLSKPIAGLPVSSVEGGTYATDQTITLSSPTDGAQIYYTTDGTEPTDQSTLYTGPITLSRGSMANKDIILKAVAYVNGMESSGVMTEDYNLIQGLQIGQVGSSQNVFLNGNQYYVTANVSNYNHTAIDATVSANVPKGWTTNSVNVSVPSLGNINVNIPVTPPVEGTPDYVTLSVYGSDNENETAQGSNSVKVLAVPDAKAVALALDAGMSSSPVFANYTSLSPNNVWSSSTGYGWVGSVPQSRDRGTPSDALQRDLVQNTQPATLRLPIPAGVHTIYLLSGDNAYSQGNTIVSMNGTTVAQTNGTALGQFKILSFNLDGGATGKTVDIQFTGDPGRAWVFNALWVSKEIPVTTATLSPATPEGAQDWHVSPVTMSLKVNEYSQSVASTVYSMDNGTTWNTYTGPIKFSRDGQFTVQYYSIDTLGVEESPKTIEFNLDQTAPVTNDSVKPGQPDGKNGWYVHPVTVTLSASDNLSGVAKTVYSLDGQNWQTYTGPITFSQDGKYNLQYYSIDNAGNAEEAQSAAINLDQTSPTIDVASPTSDSHLDAESQNVKFAVNDNLSGVNESFVSATLDGQPITNGTPIALYTLPLGQHVLTVSASDNAGNLVAQKVSFVTTTSVSSIEGLVQIFQTNELIDNQGIANSLVQKLQNNDLQSFINEVNAQSGKHVSSEVTPYLLRDANYLLNKEE